LLKEYWEVHSWYLKSEFDVRPWVMQERHQLQNPRQLGQEQLEEYVYAHHLNFLSWQH